MDSENIPPNAKETSSKEFVWNEMGRVGLQVRVDRVGGFFRIYGVSRILATVKP